MTVTNYDLLPLCENLSFTATHLPWEIRKWGLHTGGTGLRAHGSAGCPCHGCATSGVSLPFSGPQFSSLYKKTWTLWSPWSFRIQRSTVWRRLSLKSMLLWSSLCLCLCLSPRLRCQWLIGISDFVLLGFLRVWPLQDQDDTLPASSCYQEGHPFTCGHYRQEQSPQHGVGTTHLLSCFWKMTADSKFLLLLYLIRQ